MDCAAVLAAPVLLVGSDLDIAEAAAPLGGHLARLNAIYLLWRLKESPHWSAIRDALAVLSDHLNDEGAPIDYQRRRRLDYRHLLRQDEWDRICRGLGRPRNSVSHPRKYLQHRIRGTTKPRSGPDGADMVLGELPCRLTPELSRALHRHAMSFLALQGIDEPVVWEPPMSIVDGLVLPGVGIGDVDIGALHRLIRVDRRTIAATRQRLGVSGDLIRFALEQHPAPALPPPPRAPRIGARRPGKVYQRAAEGQWCAGQAKVHLLQDGCPSCDAPQRWRAPAYQLPEPGRCDQPTRDPGEAFSRQPSLADIAALTVTH